MEWQGNYYQRDRGLQPPAFTPGYKTTGLRSPRKPLLSLQHSLSEVPGPVFGRHELDPLDNDLIHNHVRDGEAIGQRIIVQGRVPGRRGHRPMAPHISFCIVARGINIGLNTRMYFADEAAANTEDPVLGLVEQEERRQTLIAPRESRGGQVVYRFDAHLQGDRETVFFEPAPCTITVAITGLLPRKAHNPAVPITVAGQVESSERLAPSNAAVVRRVVELCSTYGRQPAEARALLRLAPSG